MHKKVLAEYKKFNAALPPLLSANEESVRIFYEKVKASGKPVKREINSITRLKNAGKEYFIYHQELRSHDSLGNEIEAYMPHIGVYELPHFDFIVDPHTDAKIPNGIKSHETVYELEWPKDFIPELEKDVTDKASLQVKKGSRRYGGYDSIEEFKSHSFDELVTWGIYGTYTPKPADIYRDRDKR